MREHSFKITLNQIGKCNNIIHPFPAKEYEPLRPLKKGLKKSRYESCVRFGNFFVAYDYVSKIYGFFFFNP